MSDEIITLPEGVPINEHVNPATTWGPEITDSERQIAADKLAALLEQWHEEIYER